MPPIGIRRNNPMNLEPNEENKKNPWLGQTIFPDPQPKFLHFQDMKGLKAAFYGIRAGAQCVIAKQDLGFKTLAELGDGRYDGDKLISAGWAPLADNPGSEHGDYGRDLCEIIMREFQIRWTNSTEIPFDRFLHIICMAIVLNEQGYPLKTINPLWYPYETYTDACWSALRAKGRNFETP